MVPRCHPTPYASQHMSGFPRWFFWTEPQARSQLELLLTSWSLPLSPLSPIPAPILHGLLLLLPPLSSFSCLHLH